jgi:hypothetical protein
MKSTFFFDNMTGTLKKGKSRAGFERALEALLTKHCGKNWDFRLPDDGYWGDDNE